jgi:hypothetical protein
MAAQLPDFTIAVADQRLLHGRSTCQSDFYESYNTSYAIMHAN